MARPKDQDTPAGRQRQEAKYQRILDAALVVFAEKGFHEAKISEIAKQAGVADGTIYLYFKNKDDLLISLFESKLEAINTSMREQLDGVPEVQQRLRRFIEHHLELAASDPHLAAFITVELRRSTKFMKDYAKRQFGDYIDLLGQIVEDGKASGDFASDISAGAFKHLVFGCLDQAVVTWVFKPNRKPEDLVEVGSKLTEFVKRGLSSRS